MMDETLDSVTGIDTEDMEEEIQKEVDKVCIIAQQIHWSFLIRLAFSYSNRLKLI